MKHIVLPPVAGRPKKGPAWYAGPFLIVVVIDVHDYAGLDTACRFGETGHFTGSLTRS